MEGRFELGQGFERSAGARPFIDLELDLGFARLRFAVRHGERHGHGDNLVFEFPGGLRGQGLPVAVQREPVGRVAADAVAPRQALGRQTHREIRIRVVLDQPGIDRDLVAAKGHEGHGFGAARDNYLRPAAAYAFGSQRDSLKARGAVAVDGHGRRLDGHARTQRRDARHVHSLLALGHGAAENHVPDGAPVQIGDLIQRTPDGDSAQVVRPRGAQHSPGSFPHRRAHGADNDSFSHRFSLRLWDHSLTVVARFRPLRSWLGSEPGPEGAP